MVPLPFELNGDMNDPSWGLSALHQTQPIQQEFPETTPSTMSGYDRSVDVAHGLLLPTLSASNGIVSTQRETNNGCDERNKQFNNECVDKVLSMVSFEKFAEEQERLGNSTNYMGEEENGGHDDRLCRNTPMVPEPLPLTDSGINDREERHAAEDTRVEVQASVAMEERQSRAIGMTDQSNEVQRSEADDAEHSSTDTPQTGMDDQILTAESDVNFPVTPAESEKEPEPEPPAPPVAGEVVKAVAKAARKLFKKGDVAIILDCDDLTRALLIPSARLRNASTILSFVSLRQSEKTPSGLAHILVLDLRGAFPTLRPLGLETTVAGLESHYANESKIKVERGDDDAASRDEDKPRSIGEKASTWITAHRTLFEVIDASATKRLVFGSDATNVPAKIRGVVDIAKQYGALRALEDAFDRSLPTWIGNKSLSAAMRDAPASWLDITIKMRNLETFKEAFVHSVGALDSFPNSVHDAFAEIDPNMRMVLDSKVTALKEIRGKIDWALSGLMLATRDKVPIAPGVKGRAFVSALHEPVAYFVNQLFRDWIMEHLHFLRDEDEEWDAQEGLAEQQSVDSRTSATCTHMHGTIKEQCMTVGGFYRLIDRAGDSYLPFDEVLELCKQWRKSFGEDSNVVKARAALTRLKAQAKAIVFPLVQSQLQYGNADELEYLTCVKAFKADVPWKTEGEDDEGDDGEDEDEDGDEKMVDA